MRRRVPLGGLAALTAVVTVSLSLSASASAKEAPAVGITFQSTAPGHTGPARLGEIWMFTVHYPADDPPRLETTRGPVGGELFHEASTVCTVTEMKEPGGTTVGEVHMIGYGSCVVDAIFEETARNSPINPYAVTTVPERFFHPELTLLVTPEVASAGSAGEARAEASTELNPVQQEHTPGVSSATPSVCKLVFELNPGPSHPGPQPLGPAHEAVDFLAAGTCTIVAKTHEYSLGLPGDRWYQFEPAEIQQSVTVTGATDNQPSTTTRTPTTTGTAEPESKKTPTEVVKAPTNVRTSTKTTKKSAGIIPGKVRAVLLKDARSVAANLKDGKPYDIQAVLTTERRARQVVAVTSESRDRTPLSGGGRRIYFIVMKGIFNVTCHGAGGCRSAPVAMLRVSVATNELTASITWSNKYPNLKALGVPVLLAAKAK